MKCPNCQLENPEDKKFCDECGAQLFVTCPHCHALIVPGKKFCSDCGHRLEGEPSPTAQPIGLKDSERKQVTVLFSDLSDYTALSEKLDPEEVKEIMGKVFGEIAKVVARWSTSAILDRDTDGRPLYHCPRFCSQGGL